MFCHKNYRSWLQTMLNYLIITLVSKKKCLFIYYNIDPRKRNSVPEMANTGLCIFVPWINFLTQECIFVSEYKIVHPSHKVQTKQCHTYLKVVISLCIVRLKKDRRTCHDPYWKKKQFHSLAWINFPG
jgi:DNA-directed RNA polymerase subunit L